MGQCVGHVTSDGIAMMREAGLRCTFRLPAKCALQRMKQRLWRSAIRALRMSRDSFAVGMGLFNPIFVRVEETQKDD